MLRSSRRRRRWGQRRWRTPARRSGWRCLVFWGSRLALNTFWKPFIHALNKSLYGCEAGEQLAFVKMKVFRWGGGASGLILTRSDVSIRPFYHLERVCEKFRALRLRFMYCKGLLCTMIDGMVPVANRARNIKVKCKNTLTNLADNTL